MADDKKNNINMIYCTQDCATCPSACDIDLTDEGPGFFDRLEQFSENVEAMGEDNFIDMLNQIAAELEKEEDDEAEGKDKADS